MGKVVQNCLVSLRSRFLRMQTIYTQVVHNNFCRDGNFRLSVKRFHHCIVICSTLRVHKTAYEKKRNEFYPKIKLRFFLLFYNLIVIGSNNILFFLQFKPDNYNMLLSELQGPDLQVNYSMISFCVAR